MILVTGASGLIGRAVTEHLVFQGKEVRAQVRSRSEFIAQAGLLASKVEVREVDFTQTSERQMRQLVEGCSQVVHCAGLVHNPAANFQAYELLNVRTTKQLSELAGEAGVQAFVFLSTVAVYGNGPFENINEDRPLKPVTPYAVSKMNCEQELMKLSTIPLILVLRLPLVFGPGDRGNMLKLIRQINTKRYFNIGTKPIKKSVICAGDAALAIGTCISALGSGVHTLNVANPVPVDLDDLVTEIGRLLGFTGKYATFPEPLVAMGVKLLETILRDRAPVTWEQIERLRTTVTVNTDRLLKATGFSPRYDLNAALKAEIDWARAVSAM